MNALQQAKQEVLLELKAALGKGYTPMLDELETPRVSDLGDLAFPCFGLASGLKRSPVEIAAELAPKLRTSGLIARVDANGPYVNIRLNTVALADLVMQQAQSETYGHNLDLAEKTVMVEYAQPNTHKEIHVGHLRNALVGQVVVNLLRANGAKVISTSYINDLGAHVAKCLWAVRTFHQDEKVEPGQENALLAKAYVEATRWLDEHPEGKEEIQKVFQLLEKGDREWRPLWRLTRGWSMKQIRGVFKELGLTIEQWYFESALMKRSKRIIRDLLRRGLAVRSEGAIIVPLQDEGLGVNLLERTDGTLLYNAKDLALAYQKEDDHHPGTSIYVVDVRQSLAMRQLFATLRRMGFEATLRHLSYEIVTLPEGAMSSRKGNVLRYEDLRDRVVSEVERETRLRHPKWSERKIKSTARSIAMAAMKFSILLHDLDKVVVFDVARSLSFDGCTGPYLLYTISRIESILRKAKRVKEAKVSGGHVELWGLAVEAELVRKVAEFPDVIQRAGQTFQISAVAQYAFDLAKTFSEFYEGAPVLKSPSAVRAARLSMCLAAVQTLKNALQILGIGIIKEM